MLHRSGAFLILSTLLLGCGEDKAAQCDKLAQSIRGTAKKELPAANDVPEPKPTPSEKEISRALRKAGAALSRELDDWQLKRPDKNSSEKGSVAIQHFASGLASLEVKDPALQAAVKEYSAAVKATWEFSKERVEADNKAKGEASIAKVEAAQNKIVEGCK